MYIIEPERVMYMSTIIGVCGKNICFLMSDSRKIGWKRSGEVYVQNDNTQKIFRLNDKVVYGAAGEFRDYETLTEPLDRAGRKEMMSYEDAVQAIFDYEKVLKQRQHSAARHYIVGGKRTDGSYAMQQITWDGSTFEYKTKVYEPCDKSVAVLIALPPALSKESQVYLKKVENAVLTAKDRGETFQKLAGVIQELAEKDISVGGDIMVHGVEG